MKTLLDDLAAANHDIPSLLRDLGLSPHDDAVAAFGNQNVVVKVHAGGEALALKVPHYARRPPREHGVLRLGCRKEGLVLAAASTGRVPRLEGAARDGSWLLREWIAGRSLEDLVMERPRRPELLTALTDCARELFAAFHRSSLGPYILRDFKPANLVLDRDGRLRIVDLGSVRRECDPVAGSPADHYRGSGKWRHWPPELLCGDAARCDRRVDIFAFGVAAFRILTGEYPYSNRCADVAGMKRAYADEFERACETLAAAGFWIETLRRCLDPNPETRLSELP